MPTWSPALLSPHPILPTIVSSPHRRLPTRVEPRQVAEKPDTDHTSRGDAVVEDSSDRVVGVLEGGGAVTRVSVLGVAVVSTRVGETAARGNQRIQVHVGTEMAHGEVPTAQVQPPRVPQCWLSRGWSPESGYDGVRQETSTAVRCHQQHADVAPCCRPRNRFAEAQQRSQVRPSARAADVPVLGG